ncbi:MAG: hypothetical protein CBC42_00260 [Betaproteobacteria bacterium TMED82]|nr:MAG: hypothetical protein CBC42_00260 [Betaproteobacteria bacterium TMED82]|tara:strand:- start:5576 stop:7000 length:1425 start_codon:yes stop_codon:yes gene_type:complete
MRILFEIITVLAKIIFFPLKILVVPFTYIFRKLPYKTRRKIAAKWISIESFFRVGSGMLGSLFAYDTDKRENSGIAILYILLLFLSAFLVWAYFAEFDQVITAEGKVYPYSRLKTIEHFEGGLVDKIHVSRGDFVNQNDLLVSLSPLQAASDYNIQSANVALLGIRIARLQSEYSGKSSFLDKEPKRTEFSQIFDNEKALFLQRMALRKANFSQKDNDIKVALARLGSAKAAFAAAREELDVVTQLVAKGLESRLSKIKSEKSFSEAKASQEIALQELNRAKAELKSFEFESQAEILTELSKAKADYLAATQGIRVLADKADRTQIKSPIDGIVNRILVSTVGSAVKSGEPVVEIVPADTTIVVECNVTPSDIGFIALGQKAQIKITAYDFSVFGALTGIVSIVAADTTTNDQGENFYVVKVDLDQDYLTAKDRFLKVIPGMTAQVDIITGKRSPLEYIFSPITKVLKESFREK